MNKKIMIILVFILFIIPSVSATYKTGWFGEEKRVSHGNYSVAEIEGLYVRTDLNEDYYYSSYDQEKRPYDTYSISVYEINQNEIGLLKNSNFETNIFNDNKNYHIYFNKTINGIQMYSYDRPTNYMDNVNYTYGVCEKDGHTYYMQGKHFEINESILKEDADLFKEILDSIQRND